MPEATLVRNVFSSISRRYDLANRVISFGLDARWRRNVVRRVKALNPAWVVDLATGSGDLAFALRKALPAQARITGLDFCEAMLDVARRKQAARPGTASIEFAQGDALNLALADNSVDVLTIGWGLRNVEDRQRALREAHRVLRPGGVLYCLEFSQPYGWLRRPYYFYMNNVLPTVARILTGDKSAYYYLAGTVAQFPGREALAAEMREAGFAQVTAYPQLGSVIAIHEAVKAPAGSGS